MRCLAYIINLIVKDILSALKSGNIEEATSIYNNLKRGGHHSFYTLKPLAKIRILAI
jgi:hypothetical protein